MKFVFPIDGDVLFSVADGEVVNDTLLTQVTLSAPKGRTIQIGGVPACETDEGYIAKVPLSGYRNTVIAEDMESGEKIEMLIYWYKDAYRTYRVGVDDVLSVFERIWRNQDQYRSLFDAPFFAMFRDLHDQYGVPVHMHVYYQNDDGTFNLSMFPDKYKDEFRQNADWLKFTFHSLKDKPNSPYKYASYEEVMRDGQLVQSEILRFAGPEVFSHITSQHWADSNLEATRAFRDLGFSVLDAYFQLDKKGDPYVSYYLNPEQVKHAENRDFWVDNAEKIIFVKDDININDVPLDEIVPYMEQITAAPNHGFHYLLIHEQYFYEDFYLYLPDYRQRLFTAVDWCHTHGYRPATLTSVALQPGWFDEDK